MVHRFRTWLALGLLIGPVFSVRAIAAAGPGDCLVRSIRSRPASREIAPILPARYYTYRRDTLAGIELMRDPDTGWVRDKMSVHSSGDAFSVRTTNENTSPTNLALDLINQLGQIEHPSDARSAQRAEKNLDRVTLSLENAPFHVPSGLFFSWYSTRQGADVRSRDVSSVDNIHLALALWTLKETRPTTAAGIRAEKLFARMDFSAFYDTRTGLLGGNLKYQNEHWALEDYRFSNLGSEARSIYALVWALGLFHGFPAPDFPVKSLAALKSELYDWNDQGKIRPILKTWDGGAFQLLLPKLLLNEERYSPRLADIFRNYSDYVAARGQFHSASQIGFDDQSGFAGLPGYLGKMGVPELVSSDHRDIHDPHNRLLWDLTITPHAAMMAATLDPVAYAPILAGLEKRGSGSDRLYRAGLGFMDGLHVHGAYSGQVVPVQISLDQGMIALALSQMEANDGLSPSARALGNNPIVVERLRRFYRVLDHKLTPATPGP